jgi:hypothetical protein
MVARELNSDKLIRLWHDDFGPEPPFPVDDETLFIAYFASAEVGCFLQLGWPVPTRILDLYTEFRNATTEFSYRQGAVCWVPCRTTAWRQSPPIRRARSVTW